MAITYHFNTPLHLAEHWREIAKEHRDNASRFSSRSHRAIELRALSRAYDICAEMLEKTEFDGA